MVKKTKSAAAKTLSGTWSFLVDEPQPDGLSRNKIVATGVAVANCEGIEAVSIRKLASQLNVSAMALYHYIPSKQDLLNLMLDQTYEDISFEGKEGLSWRGVLSLFAAQNRERFERHKWIMSLPLAGRQYGPQAVRMLEWHLEKLSKFELDARFSVRILGLIYNFVIGFVSNEGIDAMQTTSDRTPLFSPPVLATGRYPYVKRFADAGVEPPDDVAFTRALGWLLDGVAGEIPKSKSRSKATGKSPLRSRSASQNTVRRS